MLNKEVKQNKALLAILGKSETKENPVAKQEVQEKNDTVVEQQGKKEGVPLAPAAEQTQTGKKKRNERSYERYRGKAGNQKTKPMSYYITDDHIKAIAMKIERGCKDKSEVVRNSLELYLKAELREIRRGVKSE